MFVVITPSLEVLMNYRITQYGDTSSPTLTSAAVTTVAAGQAGLKRGFLRFVNQGTTDIYLDTVNPPTIKSYVLKGGATPVSVVEFLRSDDTWYATTSGPTGNDLRVIVSI
jgi:hypothetical protein